MTGEEFAEYELRRLKAESLAVVVRVACLAINELIDEHADGTTELIDVFRTLIRNHAEQFNPMTTVELP